MIATSGLVEGEGSCSCTFVSSTPRRACLSSTPEIWNVWPVLRHLKLEFNWGQKMQWALRWMHCHHFESPLTTVYSTDRECYLMAMVTLVIQNRVTLARRAIL